MRFSFLAYLSISLVTAALVNIADNTQTPELVVVELQSNTTKCTWDGVQINDPVSWDALKEYEYQTPGEDTDEPTHIDNEIRVIVKKMTVKEKIGQMTQIQVGQLVDCNGFLNETAVRYWINEWKVGSFLESPGNHNGRYRWYSPQT
ncbi:hypothetical protein LPJ72_004680, partial [Coemansia sp. Benny D160-2]